MWRAARTAVLLGTLLLLLPSRAGYALEAVEVGAGPGYLPLGTHVEYLEDPAGELTIADVAASAFDGRFAPSPGEGFNAGLTTSAWWLRFRLHDAGNPEHAWLVELPWAVVDRVERYAPDGSGGFAVAAAGERIPFERWEVAHRTPPFTLPFRAGADATYYLRVAGDDTMLLSPVLWSAPAFAANELRENFGFGLYYGALFALVPTT